MLRTKTASGGLNFFNRLNKGEDLDEKDRTLNSCLQHGSFLGPLSKVMDLKEDDYILFTDADIRIQRDLNEKEIELLEENKIFVQYARKSTSTLAEIVPMVKSLVPLAEIAKRFGVEIFSYPHYHTPVFGASYKVWKQIHQDYLTYVDLAMATFGHYGVQEWILSYVLSKSAYIMHDPLSINVQQIAGSTIFPEYAESTRMYLDHLGVWRYVNSLPIVFIHKPKYPWYTAPESKEKVVVTKRTFT